MVDPQDHWIQPEPALVPAPRPEPTAPLPWEVVPEDEAELPHPKPEQWGPS